MFKPLLTLTALGILSSPTAWACSCLKKEAADYLDNCQQLFIATLAEVKLQSKDGPLLNTVGTFAKPTHIIKGDASIVKSIANVQSGTSCDTNLQVGEEYVVCGNNEAQVNHSMCGFSHSLYGDTKLQLMKLLSKEISQRHKKTLAGAVGE